MAKQIKIKLIWFLCFSLTFLVSCSTFSEADTAFRKKYKIISSTDYALMVFGIKKRDLIKWYKNKEKGHPWDYAE
jgi:hypothetical protein|tara:strand:- start:495 stop:719 length:225 start_codon:yes stop_codon:yes gene_type:complete